MSAVADQRTGNAWLVRADLEAGTEVVEMFAKDGDQVQRARMRETFERLADAGEPVWIEADMLDAEGRVERRAIIREANC